MGYRELEPIAASFGLTAPGAAAFGLQRHGRRYEISLDISSGVPVGVTIWLASVPRSAASFRRGGAQLPLDDDAKTGEPAFDRDVWIDTTVAAEVIARMLQRAEAKQAIRDLIAPGDLLELRAEGIVVKRLGGDRFAIEPIHSAVDGLARLDAALPNEPPVTGRGYTLEIALLVLSALWGATGVVAFMLGLDRFITAQSTPFWAGPIAAFVLAAIATALTGGWIRGRPRSSSFTGLIGTVLVCTVPFHGIGDALCVNGFFAPEPPRVRQYTVVSIEPDSEGGPPELELASRDASEPITYRARGYLVGSTVSLRAGALGWEFLE